MASAYSTNLLLKVLAAYERKMKTSEIAHAFSVCPAWARRVRQRFREIGEVAARPMGGARYLKTNRERLAELVAEQSDATLAELCERGEVDCSQSGIGSALELMNLTLRKRRSMQPSRIDPTSRCVAESGCGG